MIINGARFNNKDILEMKLNGSVIYPISIVVDSGYDYNMTFPYSSPIPSWLDDSQLTKMNISYPLKIDESNGYMYTSNKGTPSSISKGMLKIDYTGATEEGAIAINYTAGSEGTGYDYGAIHLIPNSTAAPSISSSTNRLGAKLGGKLNSGELAAPLTPGNIYYLYVQYYKDGSSNGDIDQVHINSILLKDKYYHTLTNASSTNRTWINESEAYTNGFSSTYGLLYTISGSYQRGSIYYDLSDCNKSVKFTFSYTCKVSALNRGDYFIITMGGVEPETNSWTESNQIVYDVGELNPTTKEVSYILTKERLKEIKAKYNGTAKIKIYVYHACGNLTTSNSVLTLNSIKTETV